MQPTFDISIIIGGDAGQGVESSGSSFSLALARAGLHVCAVTDYRSRIRGGHNFYQIRAASQTVYAHHDPVHLVLALTQDSIEIHRTNIARQGGVIYDASLQIDKAELERLHVRPFPIPLIAIAEANGSKVMMNTAAQAAAAGLIGLPCEYIENVVSERFGHKGAKMVESNVKTAREAFAYAQDHYGRDFAYRVRLQPDAPRRLLINGNEAFALGAAVGGCRFIAAYPMTPATTIFEWLTAHAAQIGIVTKQAEDEIAAALMAAGAAYAGARAMTATSGGGFNLMTETVGMAGMCELPLVLVNVQRGGPSTGLPTRTEQADLLFVMHPSHGDFPRIITAPGTVQECFTAGWRSFNLAEQYQCPVIVLSDEHLASSLVTIDWDELKRSDVHWVRGKLVADADLEADQPYQRYAFTPDGISPRALPGQAGGVHAPATDEHLPDAHINEEIDNRIAMMQKRMQKMVTVQKEIVGPHVYGAAKADISLVVWGSLVGAAREAADLLSAKGRSVNVVHFTDLWPFPVQAATEVLKQAKHLVAVEQNYSGHLVQLIRMATGISIHCLVSKYDGRPISPAQIVELVESQLNTASQPRGDS